MKAFLDTNILLRARDRAEPEHEIVCECVDRLLQQDVELCYCAQNQVEMWAAATRPRDANGWGLEIADARRLLADVGASFTWIEEPRDLMEDWLELCVEHQVRGRKTYDARLVAVMLGTGIHDLVTLNDADFRRFSQIRCIVPGREETMPRADA